MISNRDKIILIVVVIAVALFVHLNAVVHQDAGTGNATAVTRELIGKDTLGSVEVIRNVGNPDGEKIAYVVGVHPLENDTHQTLLNLLPKTDNLSYCYDIYVVNVSEDFSVYGELHPDDQPGRNEGQELVYKYVYPQVVNGSYKACIDVHAHGGAYPYDTFVFCPVEDGPGVPLARNVSRGSENISYYDPQHTTSGPYLTVPLNENGVPSFYFEENSYFDQKIKDLHMMELIRGVDNLKI